MKPESGLGPERQADARAPERGASGAAPTDTPGASAYPRAPSQDPPQNVCKNVPRDSSIPDATATAFHARDLLSPEGAARVAAFVQARRDATGLFCDRAGHPDLYYTVFGLGALLALGVGLPPSGDIRPFLDAGSAGGGSFTDWASRIRCLRCLILLGEAQPGDTRRYAPAIDGLNRYRSADGGYAHEREQAEQGTVYAAYLAEQAYRDAGIAWPGAAHVIASLDALRTTDGGYTNHPGTRGATTTATAAAIVLLARYGKPGRAQQAAAFLATVRHPDGGYRAAAPVLLPDLLSTATALYAESLCEPAAEKPPFSMTAAFIEGLWQNNGGFSGHAADSVADVEYTFYALLALGALAVIHRPEDGDHTQTQRPVSNRR